MTTTHVYKSGDPGLPSLSGTAGTLIALLDAVLVNGGTTQSITSITRSGTTATATKTAHGFRDGAYVTHAGADQAEYNVTAQITVVDANTYTYTVSGSPASPATGTITAKMAGVGWAKSFSGTNKAVYRAPEGNRFYLRVLDDGTDGAQGPRVANIRGYESMTGVDTGTGDFPSVAQMASGDWVSKSSTADSTARPWIILADEKRVIVLPAYYASLTDAMNHWCFGDAIGVEAGDAYATAIFGCTSAANAVSTAVGGLTVRGNIAYSNVTAGLYLARQKSGGGSSQNAIQAFTTTQANGSGNSAFPVPGAGGHVWAEPIQILDGTAAATSAPRGIFPGILYCRNFLDVSTFPLGTVLGRYEVVRFNTSSAQCYLIDTGDWE